jgi:glycogen synthase
VKILFWTDGFWPRLGGIETHGFVLIQELQKRGHEFRVISQKDHPDWLEAELFAGISIKRFDFNAVLAKGDLKWMCLCRAYLEKIKREFEPDIILLNATLGGSAFAFMVFMKIFSEPLVLTAHAPYLDDKSFSPYIAKIVENADRIVCVSNWVLKEMHEYFPSIKDKMRLIYNGLAIPDTEPLPLPFSPPTLLLFGRIVPTKGFKSALMAFSLLKTRGVNARLIIAGDGPERELLEKLAIELGVSEWIQFTGVLTVTEVFETYNRATVVIVPSIIESFGLVILEAMLMKRPVIASSVEGIPEVVSEGETGLLVPPENPMALSEAIQFLLERPEKAIQMGLSGYEKAKKFSLKENVDQFEDLLQELVGT